MNRVFKALADPTRRRILRLLAGGEKTAGLIASAFPLGKPAISHHLAILKQAGLIRCRRSGQQLHYSLNTTVLQDVAVWALDLVSRPDSNPESDS
ncbi:MAG: transcriptional repressor SdpR [Isosphaeraceae bacterium]|jgi:DNA-binding transcriptional ArsR family regulator|nr:MAG: transcriptional repressor SdpR [Isosphaeraceae bacterium]